MIEDHAIFSPGSRSSRGCRSSSDTQRRGLSHRPSEHGRGLQSGGARLRRRTPARAGRFLCRPEGRPRHARSDLPAADGPGFGMCPGHSPVALTSVARRSRALRVRRALFLFATRRASRTFGSPPEMPRRSVRLKGQASVTRVLSAGSGQRGGTIIEALCPALDERKTCVSPETCFRAWSRAPGFRTQAHMPAQGRF